MRTSLTFLLVFCFFCEVTQAKKKRAPHIKLGAAESIGDTGLKLRVFKDTKANPLPALSAVTLKKQDGDKVEVYRPSELWLHEEFVGNWSNDDCSIIIGRITTPFPSRLPLILNKFVTKKMFEKWKHTTTPPRSPQELHTWLQNFCAHDLSDKPQDLSSPNKTIVFKYDALPHESDQTHLEVYIVANPKQPKEKYALVYIVPQTEKTQKSIKEISRSIASLEFTWTPDKQELKQLKTKKSAQKQGDYSPEYIASKEAVIKNIKNCPGWWFLETENYIIASNLKKRNIIRDIQDIETCRRAFETLFSIKAPVKAVSVIRVFRERDEYKAYVPESFEWTGGLWSSRQKELIVSPMDWAQGKKKREMIVTLLYHEGFHQFIHYAVNETPLALWFNEGHATFFEGLNFKGKTKFDIEQGRYLKRLKEIVSGGDIDIERLIKMPRKIFYSEDEDVRRNNYALAWGLIYYLRHGADLKKSTEKYTEIIPRYYDAAIAGNPPSLATKKAWKGIDIDQFQKDFIEFWANRSSLSKAKRKSYNL